ncbi:hypothetical protein FRC07_003321 [Ceratobasidium sp. 392]|nr:hypothetical protein FRC07_003321 [Ceratobasidium sp. 392]
MKRLTGDLTTFVRLEIRGDKDDGTHNWLARAWRAYQLSSDLGDTTFGAFSFSWIALGSVLDALNELDKNFLPPTGPIVPPFLPATTKPEDAMGDLDEFPLFDLDRWEWDDDVKSKRGIRNDTGGPASTPPQTPPQTRNHADSSGSSPGGGRSGCSGGNGQGRKKISPRGSYDGRQVNRSSTSGSTNTNGTGRGRGFKILS